MSKAELDARAISEKSCPISSFNPMIGINISTVPNMHNNDETISLQIRPTASANVLELIQQVRKLTDTLNQGEMKNHHLSIDWGRDSSGFIQDAIRLVKHDIIVGILLAALILYAFLRSFSSVFVVSVVIPISILSSFILLHVMDRSLNVILLAGVSFAISMIIDSSIVVVENIHRHHSMGKRMFESCIDGTKEVLGALFDHRRVGKIELAVVFLG